MVVGVLAQLVFKRGVLAFRNIVAALAIRKILAVEKFGQFL